MRSYVIKSGDTLSEIARHHGISLDDLLTINPQVGDADKIHPGQTVNVPELNGEPSEMDTSTTTYTVKPGDTLSEIANRLGLSLDHLLEANPQVKDKDEIHSGQQIKIPGLGGEPSEIDTSAVIYVIKPGDTLAEIAKHYSLSVDDLLKTNPQIKDRDKIYPGQTINILRLNVEITAATAPPATYTVKPGDTLSKIAERHGLSLDDLLKVNTQIKDRNKISPGQEINLVGTGEIASVVDAIATIGVEVQPVDVLADFLNLPVLSPSDLLARARSAMSRNIRYELGCGGVSPSSPMPNDKNGCDCSGFVCWCLGIGRQTDHPLYRSNGGWINTTSIVKDANEQTGFFRRLPGPKVGCLIVYPWSGKRVGHMGIVTEVDESGAPGGRVKKVTHCSSGNYKKYGDAIRETPPTVFEKSDTIFVWYEGVAEGSTSELPEKALKLILEAEGLNQPSKWPGGESGITIGIGYDLGFVTVAELEEDWGKYLSASQTERLKTAVGLKGSQAGDRAPEFSDIRIKRADAEKVFIERMIPLHRSRAQGAFPGMDKLPLDVQGALVSLVFNRGTRMSDDSPEDRRREMRVIRDAVARQDLREIANQLRSMKRLWVGQNLAGLLKRREDEACLVESCIA